MNRQGVRDEPPEKKELMIAVITGTPDEATRKKYLSLKNKSKLLCVLSKLLMVF